MKTTIISFWCRISCPLLSFAALLGFLSLAAQAAALHSYAEANLSQLISAAAAVCFGGDSATN